MTGRQLQLLPMFAGICLLIVPSGDPTVDQRRSPANYGQRQLAFELHNGRSGAEMTFLARSGGATLLFTKSGVTMRLPKTSRQAHMDFVGAVPQSPSGSDPL